MTTRVLIVDDEPGMSRTLAIALGEEYEVVTAQGGAEALRRLEAGERFGVILCDLMMPGVSGMDVHGALAQWAPDQAARMVFMMRLRPSQRPTTGCVVRTARNTPASSQRTTGVRYPCHAR
ncbi:MAG TPA: response regulator, partial [Polyangiaceae bacterium LLY-WYZ-15_(1-7)]|nr:response regulator [Polyangiaceae bacterium LLY-WYZ-15_(1-7)]